MYQDVNEATCVCKAMKILEEKNTFYDFLKAYPFNNRDLSNINTKPSHKGKD